MPLSCCPDTVAELVPKLCWEMSPVTLPKPVCLGLHDEWTVINSDSKKVHVKNIALELLR